MLSLKDESSNVVLGASGLSECFALLGELRRSLEAKTSCTVMCPGSQVHPLGHESAVCEAEWRKRNPAWSGQYLFAGLRTQASLRDPAWF